MFSCHLGKKIIKYSTKKLNNEIKNLNHLIDPWFDKRSIFFILGMGRSGSLFLSSLLNQSPDVCVCHEPVRLDFFAYLLAYYDENEAVNYIKSYRKKEIFYRNMEKNENIYGEINSILRRHVKALRMFFPRAKFIHLIRDGRDVIRSMMSRRTFTSKDPITSNIHPREDSPYFEMWNTLSRFEKMCWYWSNENQYLRNEISKSIRFEKLISDYTYYEEKISGDLNIRISQKMWEESVKLPKNITISYQIPHWRDWNYEMKKTFEKICGDEMEKNGYKFIWQ